MLQLIEDDTQSNPADVELDEVRISNPRLDQLLQDEHWWFSSSLYCHFKNLSYFDGTSSWYDNGNAQMIRTQELLTDIIAVAKRISPKLDEVVNSMYPPLDPRLLEARCTALVLSVSHLVLVTKSMLCQFFWQYGLIDQSLADIEEHLRRILWEIKRSKSYFEIKGKKIKMFYVYILFSWVLREASSEEELTRTSSSSASDDSNIVEVTSLPNPPYEQSKV
ncbi:unnamed protein product [Mytilus coruscus]|uniref:Transmembrane protein 98 n=1 Tax=Mytilus coruscus TaxID=42192 RepID=A0A6J8BQA3_MYTCO|nr:unnamed protein product [Mytilus coruscus]